MSRPKFATGKGDANHMLPRDYLRDCCGGFETNKIGAYVVYFARIRGWRVWAIDTSKLGGLFLDWIIGVESFDCWIEIKTPEAYASKDGGLQPGERWTIDNLPVSKRVVTSAEDIAKVFGALVDDWEQNG